MCTDVSYIEYNLSTEHHCSTFTFVKMAVINLKMDGGPFGIIFWNEWLYSKNVMSRAKPVVPVRHFHWAPKNPGKLRSFIPLRIKSPFIGGPELSGNSWRIFSTRRLVCIRRIITFQSKKAVEMHPYNLYKWSQMALYIYFTRKSVELWAPTYIQLVFWGLWFLLM